MSLVQLKNVSKYYFLGDNRIVALSDMNLTIGTGEFVAIWGPSGSGKSTLCNLIGVVDAPTNGTVFLQGNDVATLSDDARSVLRNQTIGFIFQNFNLMPVLSALENVMLPLQIQGEPGDAAQEKARARLVELGLAQHLTHRPAKLSGGQQQRVAIARALITNPALVIADEPTANLDSETAVQIIDLMRRLNRDSETTFIFSTHDQRLLQRVDRLIRLEDGKISKDTQVAAS